MAIFSKKTAAEKAEKTDKKEKVVKTPAVKTTTVSAVDAKDVAAAAALSNPVILEPHVTEKATIQSEQEKTSRVYTFKVAKNATKQTIARAIKTAYKVTPLSVRVARRPEKPITYRGRPTTQAGFKKAFVSLKKGDKIEFA